RFTVSLVLYAGAVFLAWGQPVCHAPRFLEPQPPMRNAAGGSRHRHTCGHRGTDGLLSIRGCALAMQVSGLTEPGRRCDV
ncbi:hypothetical protein EDB86DRAFT_2873134, partial [Lactarius hatsudake]